MDNQRKQSPELSRFFTFQLKCWVLSQFTNSDYCVPTLYEALQQLIFPYAMMIELPLVILNCILYFGPYLRKSLNRKTTKDSLHNRCKVKERKLDDWL